MAKAKKRRRGGLVAEALFRRLDRAYAAEWGIRLAAVDAEGRIRQGSRACAACERAACRQRRAVAIQEALRWGDPSVQPCPPRHLLWAVPLMRNGLVEGGLVACVSEAEAFGGRRLRRPADREAAAAGLRLLAERANLTNAAALELHRARTRAEQERAYAIHAAKEAPHDRIRALYLREEPELFAAIRVGDRPAAREILNRILVAIHHRAGERIDLAKGLFLELVAAMGRSGLEAGADPEEVLGANCARLAALSGVETEEALAGWLVGALEGLMDAVARSRPAAAARRLFPARRFLEAHCCEAVARDDAAQAAHLSPSRFSRLVRQESGATFTELKNRMRIDRAAEKLAESDEPLAAVALATGFRDQSYFTKVFKRHKGMTPRAYRRRARAGAGGTDEGGAAYA